MATITQDTEFIDISSTFFKEFHKARLELLYLLVETLSTLGNISLVKLASGLKTHVQSSSNYRRIQRFIHQIRFDAASLAPFILRLANISGSYTLMMDRTNWQFGAAKINFLMLSVNGDGWAIPFLWTLLPKKGNSNEQARIDLINRFIWIFGLDQIHNLVADREFIGDIWLTYLNDHRIPYDIRLRENLKVWYRGKLVHVYKLFNRLPIDQKKQFKLQLYLGTAEVYLQGCRIINSKNQEPEFLIPGLVL